MYQILCKGFLFWWFVTKLTICDQFYKEKERCSCTNEFYLDLWVNGKSKYPRIDVNARKELQPRFQVFSRHLKWENEFLIFPSLNVERERKKHWGQGWGPTTNYTCIGTGTQANLVCLNRKNITHKLRFYFYVTLATVKNCQYRIRLWIYKCYFFQHSNTADNENINNKFWN